MKSLIYILILALLTACGGGSSTDETKIETVEPEKYPYKVSIRKEFDTERWRNYEVNFENESTYLVLNVRWVDEDGNNQTKSFYDVNRSFTVYYPYTNLRYEVKVIASGEIYEEGIIQ